VVQPAKLWGVYKYARDGYVGPGLIQGVKWELMYLCILLLHRHMLQRKGHWGAEESKAKKGANQAPAAYVIPLLGLSISLRNSLTHSRHASPVPPPFPVAPWQTSVCCCFSSPKKKALALKALQALQVPSNSGAGLGSSASARGPGSVVGGASSIVDGADDRSTVGGGARPRAGSHLSRLQEGSDGGSDGGTQYDPAWDTEPQVKVPLYKVLADRFVPKWFAYFWFRTVDPDFAMPPKKGR
jgi:hypothetical protein